MKNRVGGTNVTNNPIEHVQNSAQNTNVAKNLTERIQNSARGTNIPNRAHSKRCAKH